MDVNLCGAYQVAVHTVACFTGINATKDAICDPHVLPSVHGSWLLEF